MTDRNDRDTRPAAVPLHVFTMLIGPDTVVARDFDDAWTVWAEAYGEDRADYEEHDQWRRRPDGERLSIINEDRASVSPDEWTRTTKTCGEWAAENGRGFLCSTEY